MGFRCLGLLVLASLTEPRSATLGEAGSPGEADVSRPPTEDCSDLLRFNPLPGHGWDNLREMEMSRAIAVNYRKCQKSMDDMSVLIPDGTIMTPIRNSDVQLYVELFDHWKNYTSATSMSMSASMGLNVNIVGVDASFSYDYEQMKRSQIDDRAVTTRTQARYVLYTVRFESPLAVELDPALKKICLDAIDQISADNRERAEMIAELIVQNYGTHVVLKVDVGGTILKEDFITSTFASTYDLNAWQLHVAASLSFAETFNVHSSFDISKYQELVTSYTQQTTSTRIRAVGGPPFVLGDDVHQWIGNLSRNTVVIDRSGVPLHYLINPFTFPRANQTSVNIFRSELEEAINTYYTINTHIGCMKRDAPNFDVSSNVPGGCIEASTNYSFGGMYQTCVAHGDASLCNSHNIPNFLTGGYSCPSPYTAIPLQTYKFFDHTYEEEVCTVEGLFWGCWEEETVYYTVTATYSTFWCAATTVVSNDTGLMFGGLYTRVSNNPLTGGPTCPKFFTSIHVMTELTVCVSNDYELGHPFSIPFGGFFSCSHGNPLVNHDRKLKTKAVSVSSEQSCPNDFSQHVAAIDGDCIINYCVKANAFAGVGSIPIHLPPFKDFEAIFKFKQRAAPSIPFEGGSNGGVIAAVVLGSLGIVATVVALGFVFRQKLRRRAASPELLSVEAGETSPLLRDTPSVQNE